MGTGRNRVQIGLQPLAFNATGEFTINARFVPGSTPNGHVATNSVVATNLGGTPDPFTSNEVTVTAVASNQATFQKTLVSTESIPNEPTTYRLRIAVPNTGGALSLNSIGPLVDTLPANTRFVTAAPAPDCAPGCNNTVQSTLTWPAPCPTLPLRPNQNCDITVAVVYPTPSFAVGQNVTNSFTVSATPEGQASQSFGPAGVTHALAAPAPAVTIQKSLSAASPNPPTLNQPFSYELNVGNSGNVPLTALVIEDTVPVEMEIASVTTGTYTGLADFASGVGVRVSYKSNLSAVYSLWGSSPNTTTNTTLTSPPVGIGSGYVTHIRWEYGTAQPGMAPTTPPRINGRITNPDRAGGQVAFGDTVQNCASVSATYQPTAAQVLSSSCRPFNVSGPFVQLAPQKENLSGGGPFNPGQIVTWRLHIRNAVQSSNPVSVSDLVVTDLIPEGLTFDQSAPMPNGWSFSDQGTGLPPPDVFQEVSNFAGTGRKLLRWRWNSGRPDLPVDREVSIDISTTVSTSGTGPAPGVVPVTNGFAIDLDNSTGLGQRCSGTSEDDLLDRDGDTVTAETLCTSAGTVNTTIVRTFTPTATSTSTPTSTPTITLTPTNTLTHTPTLTPTATLTPSLTPTGTLTPPLTPTWTLTPSVTPSPTTTWTPTVTITATPSPTGTRTPTPTSTPTPPPLPAPPAPPNDDDGQSRPRTETQRQQARHTNQSGDDDYQTEGQVLGIHRGPGWTLQTVPDLDLSALSLDGETGPFLLVATGDGIQLVRLIKGAAGDVDQVSLDDYVRVTGEKQNEHLFNGDELEVNP